MTAGLVLKATSAQSRQSTRRLVTLATLARRWSTVRLLVGLEHTAQLAQLLKNRVLPASIVRHIARSNIQSAEMELIARRRRQHQSSVRQATSELVAQITTISKLLVQLVDSASILQSAPTRALTAGLVTSVLVEPQSPTRLIWPKTVVSSVQRASTAPRGRTRLSLAH